MEFGAGIVFLEEGAACGEEFLERSVKVDQMAEGHALLCSLAWLYRPGGWQAGGATPGEPGHQGEHWKAMW